MSLLDTQVVIWTTYDRSRLSGAAITALLAGREHGTLSIADITLSEIAMLVTRRRISIDRPLETYLQFVQASFHVLPIDARIAQQAHEFGPLYPKDPADRLIGATAIAHGMYLITADEQIRASKEVPCIW